MKNCFHVAFLLMVLGIVGCSTREAYVNHAEAFTKATAELSRVMNKELKDSRTEWRLHYLKYILTNYIEDKFEESAAPSAIMRTSSEPLPHSTGHAVMQTTFLCRPREHFVNAKSQTAYLKALSGAFDDVLREPSNDLAELIASLGKDYSVFVAMGPSTAEDRATCDKDVSTYVDTVYPSTPEPTQQQAGLISAAGQLYGILKEIAKPALTAGLREIDSARRAAALRRFWQDKQNRESVQTTIKDSNAVLASIAELRRHDRMKAVVDAVNHFANVNWKGKADKLPSCEEYVKKPEGKTSMNFERCFEEMWDQWTPYTEEMVFAAAEYDKEADLAPDKAAAKVLVASQHLENIADGKDDPEATKFMVEGLIRIVGVVEQTRTSLSREETKIQIKRSFQDIRGALRTAN
jgi:hypothetical protein